MSNHEHASESSYQPDRPYEQLDDFTKAVAYAIADGYTRRPEDLLADYVLLARMVRRLVDDVPVSDVPPQLPPKLLALWEEEDRNNGTPPPPDTPQ